MRARVDEAALRAIITYKWVKGVVQLVLATTLAIALALGLSDELAEWAHAFRNHSTRAYAIVLGRALERATSARGLHITLLALFLDGAVTCVEGWALQRRHRWGPWLVVGVTGSLLPFEVYELFHHFRWIRLVVLLVNAAVVAFLLAHARGLARGFEGDGTGGRQDEAQPPG
ncbi:MAG TPA: DUF2127 domain-containing protein [Myxococcaceae bacterium]|nr:DUF2127 domain-containing protein [Myxococcaceae bacterium]